MGAAILDPTALVADAVTFGIARPFIYANKAARFSKYIRGGLLDIEFIAQYLQLKHASNYPLILATNTEKALKNLCKNNLLPKDLAKQLIDALNLWQIIQGILRLTLKDNYKLENNLPIPIEKLILDATNISNKKMLEDKIKMASKIVFKIYKDIFGDIIITNLKVRR